ncbi:hypothetical protein [uncultured Algibacter sp.]|uniref:hypothetical protein n=1 Tax=uncultured Algibacter sp. TaxID=298659 RepID=UPI00261146DD|nr:hypothetical protein [uncultured Algibacter sp.]
MRFKILTLLSLILLFSSCKKNAENNKVAPLKEGNAQGISERNIMDLDYIEYALDQKVDTIVQDWDEYTQIQDVIDEVKTTDLSFFNDNEKAIKLLLKDLKVNIPEPLKAASIEARLLVVETKLYKLESLSNLSSTSKEELLSTIEEFLVAFSNLNLQMNKKIEFDTRVIEKP